MLKFSKFSALTFDCYGTLIDWETGILDTLRPILRAHGKQMDDRKIIAMYSPLERELERPPYRPYREVLRGVVRAMGDKLGFAPSAAEVESLPESLKEWRPFPDTVQALRRLKRRYRLAIISNVDEDLFADTARHLEVPFDLVVTAELAKSYKPSERNFELALRRLALPNDQVLHCAESLFHDVVPARALGLTTVWVHRGKGEPSASGESEGKPDLELSDMKALADLATR